MGSPNQVQAHAIAIESSFSGISKFTHANITNFDTSATDAALDFKSI